MTVVRQIVLYLFYFACVAVVLIALLFIGSIFLMPFQGFDGSSEFVDRSGPAAMRSMDDWPRDVSPSKVERVSRKFAYSIDSHSDWYKIELDPESAAAWADFVHRERERSSRDSVSHDDRGLEGVRRSIDGPPPLHTTTGDPPSWWTPPAIEFRATEAMLWYSGFDSGVGQAAYTGYDEAQQTLWVYEYSCQHDRLWERNEIPAGEVFSRLKESKSFNP